MSKIAQAGVRRRAELLYQQLDGLQGLRRNLRPEFLAESRKHKAAKLLRQIPCIGPIRAARLIALMQTPHRFRSKRQRWTYSGLGIETHDSAQFRFVRGQLQRSKKPQGSYLSHGSCDARVRGRVSIHSLENSLLNLHSVFGDSKVYGVIVTSYPSLRSARASIRARLFLALGSGSTPCSINRTPSCKIFQTTRQSR